MTKREAPQLDLDETIYVEMARESGADSTAKIKSASTYQTIKNNGFQ